MGATDAFLLDACSSTVSTVVDRVGPSVAAVRVGDASEGAAADLSNGALRHAALGSAIGLKRNEIAIAIGNPLGFERPAFAAAMSSSARNGMVIDSIDKLHQTLDAGRIARQCMLKLLRGTLSPQPLYLPVRPLERAVPA